MALVSRHWLALSSVFLFVITLGSLVPLTELPALPGTDKTHHLLGYAMVALPIGLKRPRHWIWLLLGCVAWSGGIELVQPYVNRYGEWLDLAANSVGVAIGAGFGMFLRRFTAPQPSW